MKQVKASRIMAAFLSIVLLVSAVMLPTVTTEAAGKKTTSITLDVKSKVTMYTGSSQTIKVKSVKPTGASKKVSFQSSDSGVVKVTSKGKMTAVSKGKAVITVTSKSNKKVSKKVTVTVKNLVKKVKENQAVIPLNKKKTLKLSTNVKASALKFRSSKKSVAAVTTKGVVTGKKTGTAKITVTGKTGKAKGAKQVITVYVTKNAVKSISLNEKEKTLKPGESFALKATVNPKGAAKAVVYNSSNKKVAAVNAKGTVKAVKAGTAKITVTTIDGNKKAVCIVKVALPQPTPTIAPTKIPTKAPTAVPTTTESPSPEPTVTAEPTATVEPQPTVTVEPEPTVTVEPEPTVTAEPEPTVTAEPEPTVTAEPEPTVTAEPTATVEPQPTVTATKVPTAVPTITESPSPEPTVTVEPEPTVTVEPEPTVTAEPEPTVTVEPEPTVTPTSSGDYVYTFSKTAASYKVEKKGAEYAAAISKDDLTTDIETAKTELQNKPLTNSVFMEKWSTLTKDKLVKESEVLSSNRTLLKNFEITDGEGNTKTITVKKDGRTETTVVTPNDAFTIVNIVLTTASGTRKTIVLSEIAVTDNEEEAAYEITGKIAGLMPKDIEIKAVLKKDGTSVMIQKKTAGSYNTVMTYEETEDAYEIKVNKVYAGELCDAMSLGNIFENITVSNIE